MNGVQYYHGATLPVAVNIGRAVEQFNSGDLCWCAGTHCGGGPNRCDTCLLCCNGTTPELSEGTKIFLFAKWVREHGYDVNRQGLDLLESSNDYPSKHVTEVLA